MKFVPPSLWPAALSSLPLFSPVNGENLPIGKFSGIVTTHDGRDHRVAIFTTAGNDETTGGGGIRYQNLNMKCGNNNPIAPSLFENGRMEFTATFDYGSWFDRNYMTNCMSSSSVVLEHTSGTEWTFSFTNGGKVTSGILSFACTTECPDRSRCNSVYASSEEGTASLGSCVSYGLTDWNQVLNDAQTCPLSELSPANTTDPRTTIVEIERTLESTVCVVDEPSCENEIITDTLPTVNLTGQEIMAVPASTDSDPTEMVFQRQGDDVVVSYTYREGDALECRTQSLTIGSDGGTAVGTDFVVRIRAESVCGMLLCFGDTAYTLLYRVSVREGPPVEPALESQGEDEEPDVGGTDEPASDTEGGNENDAGDETSDEPVDDLEGNIDDEDEAGAENADEPAADTEGGDNDENEEGAEEADEPPVNADDQDAEDETDAEDANESISSDENGDDGANGANTEGNVENEGDAEESYTFFEIWSSGNP